MNRTARGPAFPLFFACLTALSNPFAHAADGGHAPDYVLKADQYGLKIPPPRKILRDGIHAVGVRGLVPTVTYPSHTTILTGVRP